jgi:glycosyltransferase involved in cell wall biosynthesis
MRQPAHQTDAGLSIPLDATSPTSASAEASVPWLTVIMPSYDAEQWINASLRSLAAEAAEGVEVLLIDSSPTSATRGIAQSYSSRLRLRVFERRDLQSWHTKTNFGVAIAETSHICWLGADDL